MGDRAILSDIHGNLEALHAVLSHVADHGIREIVCLGDIVGYGPNPRECLDLAMEFDVCVIGNHDQGVLYNPEGFSSSAERALEWTRREVKNADSTPEQTRRRWDFLCELPRYVTDDRFEFVHGSPRDPLHEYVFPEDIYNTPKIEKLFGIVRQYCFLGHTHVPGIFTRDGRYLSPADTDQEYRLGEQKVMINVGSVGQPRDSDARSCYAVLSGDRIRFHRVDYPLEKTVEKIYATPELDNFLGDRLRDGR